MLKRVVMSGFFMLLAGSLLAPVKGGAAVDINSGFRGEFLKNLNAVEKKIDMLEEAVPAEKYAWAPAEKVRSFGGVFIHVEQGNNYFASVLKGTPPAKSAPPKETDKAAIIAATKESFASLRQAALATTDADLETTVGKKAMTKREVMLEVLSDLHEHLGQLIAYSRMNGITPPWNAMNMPQ